MARIAGINIPMNKHVWIGLTQIFGVGKSRARQACEAAGVDPRTKVKDLTEIEVNAIRSQIAKLRSRAICRRESLHEHQTTDGSGLASRHSSPARPAGARSAHPHQCAHEEGSAQAGGEVECAAGQGLRH